MTTKLERPPLSWTPVRRGRIYCAPACGSSCTWENYRHARREGAAIAAALGDGWSPRVHENMGWHYGAIPKTGGADIAQVYPSGRYANGRIVVESYHSIVLNRFVGAGATPREAFADGVAQARAERDRANQAIALLEAIP